MPSHEPAMRGYRDLRAWQHSMSLVTEIYRATRTFPKDEWYGLVGQLRRAAISIPSNSEVETKLEIAKNLRYLTDDASESLMKQRKT